MRQSNGILFYAFLFPVIVIFYLFTDFVVPEFEVFKIDDTTLGVSLVRTNKFANVFYVQYKEAGKALCNHFLPICRTLY